MLSVFCLSFFYQLVYQLLLSTFVINFCYQLVFINFFNQLFLSTFLSRFFLIFLSTFITNNLWKFKNKVLPLQDPIMHTNNSNLLQKCKKKHAQFPNPLIKTQQHDKMIRMSCIKCFFWYTTSPLLVYHFQLLKIDNFVLKNTAFRAPAISKNVTKGCACHENSHSNVTKYCACHAKLN